MAGDALFPGLRRGLNWKLLAAVGLSSAALFLDGSKEIMRVMREGVTEGGSFFTETGIFHPGDNSCAIKYLWISIAFGGVFGNDFSAMLAALPAAGQYVEERKMAPYLVTRAGSAQYALGKLLSAALFGGLALALGTALFTAVLATRMPLIIDGFLLEMGEGVPYYAAMSGRGGLPYAAWAVYFAFLRGFLWGGAAGCVSIYLPNLFAVTACPMVLSFLLHRLGSLAGLEGELRLDLLLQMRAWLGSPTLTAAVVTGVVLALWCVCLWLFWRKLREGRR